MRRSFARGLVGRVCRLFHTASRSRAGEAISPQDTDRVGGKIGALVRREYGDVSDIRAQV